MKNFTTFPRIRKIWRQISRSATEFFPEVAKFDVKFHVCYYLTAIFMSATFPQVTKFDVRFHVCDLTQKAQKGHQRLKYWRQYSWKKMHDFSPGREIWRQISCLRLFPGREIYREYFPSKLRGLSGTKIMLYYIVAYRCGGRPGWTSSCIAMRRNGGVHWTLGLTSDARTTYLPTEVKVKLGSHLCKYFLTINDLYNGAKIVNLPLVVVEIWFF